MKRWLNILVLMLWSVASGYAWAEPSAPPTEAFAALPRIASMQLSPSGAHLAVLRNHGGKTLLMAQRISGQDAHIAVTTDNREYAIKWFRWVNDERLLVSIRFANTREGVDMEETRLLAVNWDGSQPNDNLVNPSSLRSIFGSKHVPQVQDRLVGLIPGDLRHILIGLDIERTQSPDVYRLDVYSGNRELVESNPGLGPGSRNILRWIADHEGKVRVGVGQSGTVVRVIYRAPGSTQWSDLAEYDLAKETGLMPLAFDADPAWLYVRDLHRGRSAIFKVNLADRTADRILVAFDPAYDLAGELVYAPWKRKLVGVRYSENDLRVLFWDFDAQRLQARIDRAIPGRANVIQSSSHDGRLHIVKSDGPGDPPHYHLFDERDGRMVLLGKAYPDLESADLAVPKPVVITARDGKELHGLLTVPKDRGPQSLPLILFPLGGPALHARDSFNYWTQWFASRGWAVLETNFRGTAGYGDDFLRAGFQRWGLEMQDDLTDAAQWAVQSGIANANRICIVGADYGGYAALMGTVKTPDLYRCAVSLGGVTDLLELVADSRWYINKKQVLESKIGSWWNDRDRLKDTSPLYRASDIHTPILLLHGAMDRVVSVSHSRTMAEVLKESNHASVRYVELPLGDHALSGEQDRLEVFTELQQFLTKHLE
jgi:dipeptidyl aminopeptidase/acylaminoacyl peptidase